MENSEAEDVNDPFADRRNGPRTRARAHKEEEEVQVQHEERVKKSKALRPAPNPTSHASFAKLRPAAFPSLNPSATIEENKEILQQQDIVRCVKRELSPFFAGEGDYFAEDQDITQGATLLSPTTLSHQGRRDFETTDLSLDTGLSRRSRGPTVQEAVVVSSVQHYSTRGLDSRLYKTFLTRHSDTGKIVRWHRRTSTEEPGPFPKLDGTTRFDEISRPSATPDLETDRGSDIEVDIDEKSYNRHYIKINRSHPLLEEYKRRKNISDMAENAAPIANSDDATRGMPYYDRLKKTLKASIKQKQDLEDTLAKIEQSIWNKEAAYLDDTSAGNIMKGFDNYIKASGAPGGLSAGGGTASRKKATVSEQDRLFSRSSVGFWNSMRVRTLMNLPLKEILTFSSGRLSSYKCYLYSITCNNSERNVRSSHSYKCDQHKSSWLEEEKGIRER